MKDVKKVRKLFEERGVRTWLDLTQDPVAQAAPVLPPHNANGAVNTIADRIRGGQNGRARQGGWPGATWLDYGAVNDHVRHLYNTTVQARKGMPVYLGPRGQEVHPRDLPASVKRFLDRGWVL